MHTANNRRKTAALQAQNTILGSTRIHGWHVARYVARAFALGHHIYIMHLIRDPTQFCIFFCLPLGLMHHDAMVIDGSACGAPISQ